MTYEEFLEQIIETGIEGVNKEYEGTSSKQDDKRDGSIAGFEACRNKKPAELISEYAKAMKLQQEAFILRVDNYWWFRCYSAQVEWVLNVVSAGTRTSLLSHLPTAKGTLAAAKILGVESKL